MKRYNVLSLIVVVACVVPIVPSTAFGQDVSQLKKAKDVSGLIRLLRDRRGKVRSSAAVALSQVIREVDDSKQLSRFVLPLVDATLRDPYSTVREYAGRGLQHCLQNITNPSVLAAAVPPLVDALNASEVEEKRRRYSAVQLSRVIPQIKHESLLVHSMPALLSATLDDPNADVREYAGRALKNALPSVRDKNTLRAGATKLAKTLQHKDSKRRQYAAVLLSWLVQKLTEQDTLRAISERVSAAAKQDRNDVVREYAGRAARHIKQELQNTVAKAGKDNVQ